MRLHLIWVGKTRNAQLRELALDYLGRIDRFTRCEVTELAAATLRDERESIVQESKRIIAALRPAGLTVLLDVEGREWSSRELASRIEQWQLAGTKELAFVTGGALGVSREVESRADARWSLSRLTFTHEMARVLLLEQIYRAYTIINGLPYQK